MRTVVALAGLLAATPAVASMCGPADKVLAALQEKYQERLVFEGVIDETVSSVVYLNQTTGTWTIFKIDRSRNTVCVDGAGLKSHVLEALHVGSPL